MNQPISSVIQLRGQAGPTQHQERPQLGLVSPYSTSDDQTCSLARLSTAALIHHHVLGGIPSTKLKAKPGLFLLASLLSVRVAFHQRDLRESPLSNHGNLSDQMNLVGTRLNVRLP